MKKKTCSQLDLMYYVFLWSKSLYNITQQHWFEKSMGTFNACKNKILFVQANSLLCVVLINGRSSAKTINSTMYIYQIWMLNFTLPKTNQEWTTCLIKHLWKEQLLSVLQPNRITVSSVGLILSCLVFGKRLSESLQFLRHGMDSGNF